MLSNTKTLHFPDTYYVQIPKKKAGHKSELKGTKRVVKLFIFCALLPGIFLIVPLYLRYRVYNEQIFPIGVSDMRIVDNKISTTWCQKQLITSNTTFNAYVIANEPQISNDFEKVDMHRSLELKDGTKEYWGFYLLKGSTFTVSACVRWPGASLIAIEGHENLKECAYVGDNSSEENEDTTSSEENRNITVINQMTKLMPGIILNPFNLNQSNQDGVNDTSKKGSWFSGVGGKTNNYHLKYAEELYRKEKTKLDQKNETAKTPDPEEELRHIVNRLKSLGHHGEIILKKFRNDTTRGGQSAEILLELDQIIKETFGKNNRSKNLKKENDTNANYDDEFRKIRKEILFHRMKSLKLDVDNEINAGQETFDEDEKVDLHGSAKHSKTRDQSKSEFWSSFSSSEERLLDCKGLLVSMPLVPCTDCKSEFVKSRLDEISKVNSISYKVQSTGYYFFIFNNENEVQTNFIHAHFQLRKAVYNTSGAIITCKNQTKECSLPLTFWSRERTILELPYPTDDGLWNEEFLFSSKCEPRSILYFFCIMTVPVSILLFAFG